AKHRQRVVLPHDCGARRLEIRGGNTCLLRNAIEPKADKAGHDDKGKVERANHACSPAMRSGEFQVGLSVRSAPRSRAERARGFARTSSGCGACEVFPTGVNVGACLSACEGA